MDYLDFSFLSIQIITIYIAVRLYKFSLLTNGLLYSRSMVLALFFFPEVLICSGYNSYATEKESVWLLIVVFMLIILGVLIVLDINESRVDSRLNSLVTKDEVSQFPKNRKLNKVTEVKTDLISITVYKDDDKIDNMVFDTSDFVVVNEFLRSNIRWQDSLDIGSKISFRDSEFIIQKVNVNIVNLFDDDQFLDNTKEYEGIDVPYIIQIKIIGTEA